MGTAFLDWALADGSGDVAVDELSDGPCWVRSAVDNRRDKRLLSEVLDPNPTHEDIRALLGRLQSALEARDVSLVGVTTDASQLYPEPLRASFGTGPHQIGEFPV